MTVAAVILSATPEGAVADTLGQPRVRRLVDLAWSGGALPVVVLSPDPDGAVARSIAETEASWHGPAPHEEGPRGQMLRGVEIAATEVHDTTAALLWPARMIWVGAETITSLIEAHGMDPGSVLRPSWQGEAGWPVLLPVARLEQLRMVSPELGPVEAMDALTGSTPSRTIELGDPGVVFDASTAEADLPPYEGPAVPAGGHVHEWGEDVEGIADAPGEGRGLAPYPQAAPGGPADA
jgi:CTP:molybdopterin cytidylyltransferase MocA